MSNPRVLMKTKSGMSVWVPKDRLAAWSKTDHESPLTEEERAKVEEMKAKIFAGRSSTKE